jgi:hypothetical protein
VLGDGDDVVLDLDGQLSRRRQDEGLERRRELVLRKRVVVADLEVELDVVDDLDAAGLKTVLFVFNE